MTFKQKFDSLKELILNCIYINIPERGSILIRDLCGDILIEADDGNLYPIYSLYIDYDVDPEYEGRFIVCIELDHPESKYKNQLEEWGYVHELPIDILIKIADKLKENVKSE